MASLYATTAPEYRGLSFGQYAQAVLADHPSAYYQFSETSGTTAIDSTIYGNNGTHVNDQLGQPSLNTQVNPAIGVGGANGGYVNVPSAAVGDWANASNVANPPGTSFEVLFKTTSGGVILGQNVAGATVDGGNPGGWVPAMYVGTDGLLRTSVFWHGSQNDVETSPTPVNNGQWHDAVVTYLDGTERLYLDGHLIAQQTGLSEDGYSSAYDYHLGVGFDSTWPGAPTTGSGWDHFNGSIDEASFYQYALTPQQVATQFAAVPEPGTFALLGCGAIGLWWAARRRMRSQVAAR